MKTALKLILGIITLSVWTLFSTMQATDSVVMFTPAQINTLVSNAEQIGTQECGTLDASHGNISDLFSEVVCNVPSSNNINLNHRSIPTNISLSLLYSTVAIKDKHDETYRVVQSSDVGNLAVVSKPQSLYYIYTLHRIRI